MLLLTKAKCIVEIVGQKGTREVKVVVVVVVIVFFSCCRPIDAKRVSQ